MNFKTQSIWMRMLTMPLVLPTPPSSARLQVNQLACLRVCLKSTMPIAEIGIGEC